MASTGLQKVDYRYNIRGWLTDINNVRDLTILSEPEDLFAFQISYDSASLHVLPVEPLYNGNISETFWRTNSDNMPRKYGYVYDDLNRLKDAYYQKDERPVVVTNSYNEHLKYDKNGNITDLQRNGNLDDQSMFIQIDDLDYSYDANSNLLKEVRDNSNDPMGFKDSPTTGTDYGYDANGNMISDANKGITQITYNHLNLPVTITFGTTGTISYLYDATGRKVKKYVSDYNLQLEDKTDYMNGFQYKNQILQFFPTAEGYVNTTYCENCQLIDQYKISYVYNYTDHLGNIRVSYAVDPDTGDLKILEENHYYPFGLKHTNYNGTLKTFKEEEDLLKLKNATSFFTTAYQYKYNGKEFQDELGLNMYDYGARNYDAAIGRWMNIDNLAQKYHTFSPYHYAGNNPILYFDIDGNEFTESAWIWVKKLISNIDSRQEKNNKDISDYQTKIAQGGSERQIKDWNKKINSLIDNNSELDTVRGEIATLADSNQTYDVEEDSNGTERDLLGNSSTVNQTYYKTSNRRVTISVSSGTTLGLFAHELKHAFQFETGQTSLAFDKKAVVNFLHDAYDEVSGYQRGDLFGEGERINSPEDLESNGHYKGLQSGPISIHNSSYNLEVRNRTELNYLATKKQQAFRINTTTYDGKL